MRRFGLGLGALAGLVMLSGCAYDRDYYGYNGYYGDSYYDGGASVGVYYDDNYRGRYSRDRYRNYYGRRGYGY